MALTWLLCQWCKGLFSKFFLYCHCWCIILCALPSAFMISFIFHTIEYALKCFLFDVQQLVKLFHYDVTNFDDLDDLLQCHSIFWLWNVLSMIYNKELQWEYLFLFAWFMKSFKFHYLHSILKIHHRYEHDQLLMIWRQLCLNSWCLWMQLTFSLNW